MKRKTRIRKEWLTKDEFSCKKCGVGNEHIGWNDKNTKHPVEQPEDVLFCKICLHELTEDEELKDLVTFIEIQYYGFWLRGFVSEHFIPCKECQDKLHNTLFKDAVWKTVKPDSEPVEIHIGFFKNGFMTQIALNFTNQPYFVVCKKCQRKLKKILVWKNLHIGNDIKPQIELWRKWHLTEEEK